MGLDNLQNGLLSTIQEHPLASTVGAAGVGAALGVGAATAIGAIKRRKTKRSSNRNSRKRGRRIKHTKRGWKQDRARFNKRQKWEVAYRKRKHSKGHHRRSGIHYTKTGQPYKIMANGRARFIKRRRRSR